VNRTIEFIAQMLLTKHYNGRVKADKKLDLDDFIQFVFSAKSNMLLNKYREARANEEYYDFNGYTKTIELGIIDGKIDISKYSIFRAPHGLGVFNISTSEDCDCSATFVREEANSNRLFSKPLKGDETIYFSVNSNNIKFSNLKHCIKKVDAELVLLNDSEDGDVRNATILAEDELPIILLVDKFMSDSENKPIDMTNDGNPNISNKDVNSKQNELNK
jgi:hypothetical protein